MATGLKYHKEEFVNLRFRVDEVDVLTYDPRVSFPEIMHYPELSDTKLIQGLLKSNLYGKMFSYIVFAYDPTSPFVRFNDSIIKRKVERMEVCGIRKKKDGKYEAEIEHVMINMNEEVNRMIIRYLKLVKNSDWAILSSYQETLFRQLDQLRSGSADKDKDTIANTQTLSKEIASLQFNFLAGDNRGNLLESLYDAIEIERLALKPEDIAAISFMKEKPELFNPYNEKGKKVSDYINEHFRNLEKYEEKNK